jgi:hypothetical protein
VQSDELAHQHRSQSSIVGSSSSQKFFSSEGERWLAIVDRTAHALIDISEVPEPLEVEQATQKRSEILAVWSSEAINVKGDDKILTFNVWPSMKSTAPASVACRPAAHAALAAYMRQVHAKLSQACIHEIKAPAEDLIAVMNDSVKAH